MQTARDVSRLSELVEPDHPSLSLRTQCRLLGISRSSLDYQPVAVPDHDQFCKRLLDEIHLQDPCLGSRRLVTIFERDYDIVINRKRLQRLRQEMGLKAIYCEPKTSLPASGHKIFPYLLRGLDISRCDHVWCADITYVPMARGNAFLCAVMDWHSRKVLGWQLSNTMDNTLCLNALDQALCTGRRPEIFNTDQGSQFTSQGWIDRLERKEILVSMDGRGRYMDNIFIERLWRSVKYECIYIHGANSISEQETLLKKWFVLYNTWRPHQSLGNKTPCEVYKKAKPRVLAK